MCVCRASMPQSSRATHTASFPPSPMASWQARYPSNAAPMKVPNLAPHLPFKSKELPPPASKRHCQSQEPQPYGSLEPLSFDFCTAVHIAAYYGHWQVIRQFIESSQCDPCQLFAARNSQVLHTSITKLLLSKVFRKPSSVFQ